MRDALGYVVSEVNRLNPGQCVTVSPYVLSEIAHPPEWTAAEWVLENIVGSAYTLSCREIPGSQCVRFDRLAEPIDSDSGLRTFVSGDRRNLYRQRVDGLYELC